MAAPHVAGAVALILHRRPGFTAEQVRRLLLQRASDIAVGVPGTTTRSLDVDGL